MHRKVLPRLTSFIYYFSMHFAFMHKNVKMQHGYDIEIFFNIACLYTLYMDINICTIWCIMSLFMGIIAELFEELLVSVMFFIHTKRTLISILPHYS